MFAYVSCLYLHPDVFAMLEFDMLIDQLHHLRVGHEECSLQLVAIVCRGEGFLVWQHEVRNDFDVDLLCGVRKDADVHRLVFFVDEDVSRIVQNGVGASDDCAFVIHVDDVDPEVSGVFVYNYLSHQLLCEEEVPRSSGSTV